MQYVVLDLEWNQSSNPKESDPDLTFEIIEIGAVKLDEQMQEIDRFETLIRPQVYTKLHYKIREITRVRMEDLSEGLSFPQAAKAFFDWCGQDCRFCTWGHMDLTELQKNLTYFHVENPLPVPLFYYDVQKLYGLQFDGKNSAKALRTVVEELKIEQEVPFHRADADTFYTMRVLQHLDMDKLSDMVSVDYYRLPKDRKSELYMKFETYSKYVSRPFDDGQKAMKDREVLSLRCPFCDRAAKKRVPWFTTNSRNYLCAAYCSEHGWLRGKIRLRKGSDQKTFVIKTIRAASEEEIQDLYARHEELRLRRNAKRHHDE